MPSETKAGVVVRLSCQAQNYQWGKVGKSSQVAQLISEASADARGVSETTAYAELWMGTHPNAPSTLFHSPEKTSLKTHVGAHGALLLGRQVKQQFGDDLPFLLKVLSVQKALSIQAHPDKQLAAHLHRHSPANYRDANHKPEMAIALTPFEGLCGFRRLEELVIHLEQFPELARVVGQTIAIEFCTYVREYNLARRTSQPRPEKEQNDLNDRDALRKLFEALMTADPGLVANQLALLVARLTPSRAQFQLGSVHELVLRLNEQYPGDVGCFCVFILNHVLLQPGQAMFLAANEPHAYLSGDCVECMATSDNVVRAGLTPKHKDVDTLVNMLTYKSYDVDDVIMPKKQYGTGTHTELYQPPVPEFSVLRTALAASQRAEFDGIAGPSVLLVTEGSGTLVSATDGSHPLKKGTVYFIGAETPIEMASNSNSPLVAFRAFCAPAAQ